MYTNTNLRDIWIDFKKKHFINSNEVFFYPGRINSTQAFNFNAF